jgi:hypothetical protein
MGTNSTALVRQEAGLPLVSTEWAKDQAKGISLLKDVACLPVPNPEQRQAIERALHNASAFMQPGSAKEYRAQLAALDTLPKRRTTQDHSDFHVEVYTRALSRAGISRWALGEAVGDFLTGVAGQTFAPSPPELIAQANVYMGKARWKEKIYKTWLEQPEWLRPSAPPQPLIDDWMINPTEVEEANLLMRRLRLRTRYSREGGAYMLIEFVADVDQT